VATPGVAGHIRRADRDLALAATLFDRALPADAVENARIVAAYRRIRYNAYSTPLPPMRPLCFFAGIIREVLDRPPGSSRYRGDASIPRPRRLTAPRPSAGE
jgi:hypothetical protein